MHNIEPFYNWRNYYIASDDERSPFYGREYSEIEFTHQIYDHFIHPQWDHFGSPTLFAKILYANYDQQFSIIELIGEWNDTLNNDIMHFKRNVLDTLMYEGIDRFLLIGENVLIFHSSDDCYYEEWFDELDTGWIAMANFQPHVLREMQDINIDHFVLMDDRLQDLNWRTFKPTTICSFVEELMNKRLTY